ncbi:hypothetical protein VNO77_17481 [Canavalia gladiata]|uniref:Uncharacterized protein n=1 Tax=Canavalia gladiata TaxID=3824 RepID=A0AAN9LMP3_CANGL
MKLKLLALQSFSNFFGWIIPVCTLVICKIEFFENYSNYFKHLKSLEILIYSNLASHGMIVPWVKRWNQRQFKNTRAQNAPSMKVENAIMAPF